MAQQAESRLQQRIVKKLRSTYPGSWWVKTSGNNRVGTPDLLGCVEGLFIALEVKTPENPDEATPTQAENLAHIRRAGGYSAVVRGAPQAVQAVAEALHAREQLPDGLRGEAADASADSGR